MPANQPVKLENAGGCRNGSVGVLCSAISTGTLQAFHHCGTVSQPSLGNLVAASDAVTEFAFFDTLECSGDGGPFGLATPLLRQCHGLHLHCIDTRETTDTFLVERDRIAIGSSDAILLV